MITQNREFGSDLPGGTSKQLREHVRPKRVAIGGKPDRGGLSAALDWLELHKRLYKDICGDRATRLRSQ